MKKEDLYNMRHTKEKENEREEMKQRIAYLAYFCKWMTEQELGEIAKIQNLIRATKDFFFICLPCTFLQTFLV